MNAIVEQAERVFEGDDAMVRWIDNLTSGDYSQCSGKLSNGEGFCCLGVLARTEFKKRERDITTFIYNDEDNTRVHIKESYDMSKAFLRDRRLEADDYIEANDSGKTFKQIAEGIVLDKEFNSLLDDLPITQDRFVWEDQYHELGFDIDHRKDVLHDLKKTLDKAA